MKEPRNPFKLRAATQISSDATFLRLFGPGVLDLLPKDESLFQNIRIFRSSPGGGKSSLFRLFSSTSLTILHAYQSSPDYKELYTILKGIGVFSQEGPNLLGTIIPCSFNYDSIDDITAEDIQKERIFFSLLNARIAIAIMYECLRLKNLEYPADLDRIQINPKDHRSIPLRIKTPCSGKKFFEWACDLENKICKTIDSFGLTTIDHLEGHDSLYILSLLNPESILIDNTKFCEKVVVMLDDLHLLSKKQRRKLLSSLISQRPPVAVWIAERSAALQPVEVLNEGATIGRDYESINLESIWKEKKFEKAMIDIADKRAKTARGTQIGAFAGCLEERINEDLYSENIKKAISTITDRIQIMCKTTNRYNSWINNLQNDGGTQWEIAIKWQELEIKITRDLNKSQPELDFGIPITVDEVVTGGNFSSLKAAAELFICTEFKIPYYYSFSKLSKLASTNIEQFLTLAGNLFEDVLSAELLRKPPFISADKQEKFIKKIAQKRWDEIPGRLPNGNRIRDFLTALGNFAHSQTYKINAPYAPGVTGFAIYMRDKDELLSSKKEMEEELVEILTTCVTHNLLIPRSDCKQGVKGGQKLMLFYLNRLFCTLFNLPLHYGGWRRKSIEKLITWLDEGFKIKKSKKSGELF